MIEYELLHAFATVIESAGFRQAATKLHLTQSAVSQRISRLEESLGARVVVRSSPPQPTEVGKALFRHWQQVSLLQQETLAAIRAEHHTAPPPLTIAANNDALYYWLNTVLGEMLRQLPLPLSVLSADESRTTELLRSGAVHAAISASGTPLRGCTATKLGDFHYRCVATKEFKRKYFRRGVTGDLLSRAPHLIFDASDEMQEEFLRTHFSVDDTRGTHITLPSTRAFLELPLLGAAWALVPEVDSLSLIKSGRLVDLTPGKRFTRAVYWHSWIVQPHQHAQFAKELIRKARGRLGSLRGGAG
jgi:LysR family transcriptional regulator (chromosome initiation inhibitor)